MMNIITGEAGNAKRILNCFGTAFLLSFPLPKWCCEVLHVAGNPDDSTMMVYAEWDSIDSHKKYVAWREETGLLQEFVSDFLESPPEFLYQSQIY